jgi:hypothetical protein
MLNKKVIVPIIAAILVALGVNLEELGIDLNQLAGNQPTSSQQSQNNNSDVFATNTNTVAAGNSNSVKAYTPGSKWSKTTPAVNLHHVFEGEINRKGKPVGYHSRPGGKDPKSARLVKIRDKPNRAGVYTAIIAVNDQGDWKEKFSSFFPDSMSQQDVVDAVLNAYRNSSDKKKQPWQGPSGLGFDIQGYTLSKGDINTAFPVYRRDN